MSGHRRDLQRLVSCIGLGIFSLILTFSQSCIYHDIGPSVSWGYMTMELNGAQWDAQRYSDGQQHVFGGHYGPYPACETEYYSIRTVLHNGEAFEREDLCIELAAVEPGTEGQFEIRRRPLGELPCVDSPFVTSRFFTIAEDGDVLQDVFDVLESEENYLRITSFDPRSLEIEGQFNVTFIVTRRSTEPSTLPDTLRFTNGSFSTRIF